MLRSRICWSGLGIFLLLALGLPEQPGAIPAFARRYRQSCTTCHSPFPRLKPYGEEFAGDGFIIPEEERERDYVTAGDELLWLNRDFPLAVRFDAYALYDEAAEGTGSQSVENDLQIPWGLKLLSGGTLYRNIGYYFYFYMSERGEVAGIEDAYVHFNDLAGQPLDLMVGQFQTSDPLMKRELRMTFEDYEIYKRKVGDSGVNLTYDRGFMATYTIEPTGTDLVAMLVNGNGKDEAGDDHKFDSDDFKNGGARISQAVGEFGSLGGFVYFGREEAASGAENEVLYWGPDLSVGFGPLTLTGQYLVRRDDNPLFHDSPGDEEVETTGFVAELLIAPRGDRSRHYVTLLYNQVETDLTDVVPGAPMEQGVAYETATLAITHLLARNLRLSAEYTRDLELERNRFVLGLVTGF
ncbi:MAG: hypothetical protein GF330_04455 [Candidatus Eisenbacteria bacterium]|nr:hypothetical protein [Candidatus Eisenbacteria bacterium]